MHSFTAFEGLSTPTSHFSPSSSSSSECVDANLARRDPHSTLRNKALDVSAADHDDEAVSVLRCVRATIPRLLVYNLLSLLFCECRYKHNYHNTLFHFCGHYIHDHDLNAWRDDSNEDVRTSTRTDSDDGVGTGQRQLLAHRAQRAGSQ